MNGKSGFIYLSLYLVLMASGQILARMGSLAASGPEEINLYHILSYVFLLSRGPLWLFLLKNYGLSSAFPAQSLSYPVILLISFFLFSEPVSIQKAAGAVLISSGVAMVLASDNIESNRSSGTARISERGTKA